MRLFKNLKARILKSIITWSEMGKQTAQAKEVYSTPFVTLSLLLLPRQLPLSQRPITESYCFP